MTLYELGSKNIFYLGGLRTRLNGSLFYNDYKDQVLTSLLSVAQAIDLSNIPNATLPPNTSGALVISYSYNAASSEIYGANIEAGIELPYNINLDFNALWLEAKVKKSQEIQDFRYQADVAPGERGVPLDRRQAPAAHAALPDERDAWPDHSMSDRASSITSCRRAIARVPS